MLHTPRPTPQAPLLLDGVSLTLEDVAAVAYAMPGDPDVQLSQLAVQQVQRAADAVQT